MFEALNKIDTAVLIWVHDHHNNIFDLFMPFVTDADNWILPILVLIFYLGIKGGKRGKITLVLLIIALTLADSICAQLLKPFFERIRPSHYGLEACIFLFLKAENGVCHQIMRQIFSHLQSFYPTFMKDIKHHYSYLHI